jgi:hypothetical protein
VGLAPGLRPQIVAHPRCAVNGVTSFDNVRVAEFQAPEPVYRVAPVAPNISCEGPGETGAFADTASGGESAADIRF